MSEEGDVRDDKRLEDVIAVLAWCDAIREALLRGETP